MINWVYVLIFIIAIILIIYFSIKKHKSGPGPTPSPPSSPTPGPSSPTPGPQPPAQEIPCCYSPYITNANYPHGVCVLNKSQTDCSFVQNQADCNNVGWPDATFMPQAFDSEKIWTHGTHPPNLCLTMPVAQGQMCSGDLIPLTKQCWFVGYAPVKSKQDCIDHVAKLGMSAASWNGIPDPGGYNCLGYNLAPNGGIYSGCIWPDWTPIRISDGAEAQWCSPHKPP